MPSATATIETVEGWATVVSDLAAKRQKAVEHAEELRRQKKDLALEAAMGSAHARKTLKEINEQLMRMDLEAGDFEAAIQKAEVQRVSAQKIEAEAAESGRQKRMSAFAGRCVALAAEFDRGLTHACEAGRELSVALSEMGALTREPRELAQLNRLAARGVYMRAAERAGLRQFIEMMAWPGNRSDIVDLSAGVAAILGEWLGDDKDKKEI